MGSKLIRWSWRVLVECQVSFSSKLWFHSLRFAFSDRYFFRGLDYTADPDDDLFSGKYKKKPPKVDEFFDSWGAEPVRKK